jgi:hypothetical protein
VKIFDPPHRRQFAVCAIKPVVAVLKKGFGLVYIIGKLPLKPNGKMLVGIQQNGRPAKVEIRLLFIGNGIVCPVVD